MRLHYSSIDRAHRLLCNSYEDFSTLSRLSGLVMPAATFRADTTTYSPLHLLSLPQEVRDRVYDDAFRGTAGTCTRFRQDGTLIIASYGIAVAEKYHPQQPGLPKWLLVNK